MTFVEHIMETIATRSGSPVQAVYAYCPAPAVDSQGVPTFPAGEEHSSHNYGSLGGHVDPHGRRGGHTRHLSQAGMGPTCNKSAQSSQQSVKAMQKGIPTGEQLFGPDQSYLDEFIDTPTRRRNAHSRQVSHMSVEPPTSERAAFQFAEEPYDLPTLPATENYKYGQTSTDGYKGKHDQTRRHARHRHTVSFAPPGEYDHTVSDGAEKQDGQLDGHARHHSELSVKSARTLDEGRSSFVAAKYAQLPDMPIPVHEQEAGQGFPFVKRPSNESIVIGAFPNEFDLLEHDVCIGLIQESQAGLESLKFQVEVGKHDAEISKDKIESLEAEIARLRTKSVLSFSDKQDYRDRIDSLMAEVRYLTTLPHNEKYLDKIKLFEDDARVYRENKFRSEQAHAKEIEALKDEIFSLTSKLKATESAYGDELRRLGGSLDRERFSKESAVRNLKLREDKISRLKKDLEHERESSMERENELLQLRMWKSEAAAKDAERINSVTALFQSVTTAVRHSNEQMDLANRTLTGLL
ncbi:hypothetical protein HDK77DRAFT_79445 [Phyllosticta capitalensis]|uniref:uncharacterized protein n=1 Tax=Phyllosticta capitalensis TaxID=121624 RepID=UPI00313117BC